MGYDAAACGLGRRRLTVHESRAGEASCIFALYFSLVCASNISELSPHGW